MTKGDQSPNKHSSHSAITERMADILRTERKRRGLTQMDLARKLRVTQGYLSKLEQAQLQPRVITWLQFCRDFGVEPQAPMSAAEFRTWKKAASAELTE